MKVFSIDYLEDGSPMGLTEETLIDLSGETFALCSNQVDRIAFGGSDKQVFTQAIKLNDEATDSSEIIVRENP